jgi:hypothetical protein
MSVERKKARQKTGTRGTNVFRVIIRVVVRVDVGLIVALAMGVPAVMLIAPR